MYIVALINYFSVYYRKIFAVETAATLMKRSLCYDTSYVVCISVREILKYNTANDVQI